MYKKSNKNIFFFYLIICWFYFLFSNFFAAFLLSASSPVRPYCKPLDEVTVFATMGLKKSDYFKPLCIHQTFNYLGKKQNKKLNITSHLLFSGF